MATFQGFAPSFYSGQGDAGLQIYIASGSIDGELFNGRLVTIPANSTVIVSINEDGSINVGSSAPPGAYSVANVTSGLVKVNCNQFTDGVTWGTGDRIKISEKGITQANDYLDFLVKMGFGTIYNVETANGILTLTDIRG